MTGRVSIVSPMSVLPGYRTHVEEGRGRGALSVFLAVPAEPANVLSTALERLHDPRGPADLDLRLGQLAAGTPEGTAFLVALENQVWVFPSGEIQVRLLRDGRVEPLAVPQVVRLGGDDRIEVVSTKTSEAIALARIGIDASPPPPGPVPPRGTRTFRTRPSLTRLAALVGGSAALVVFVLFRVFAARPANEAPIDTQAEPPREDAWVEGDLESRVLGALGDPSRTNDEEKNENEKGQHKASEWTFRARAPITSSPLVAGGAVVFGSRDSTLYCLDAETGELRWALPAGSGVGSSPRASRGICVVGTYAGRVLGVDMKTGRKKWEGRTGDKIVASPCLLEDLAVIGSNDGRVHAFRLGDGEKAWSYETKGAVRANAEAIGPERVVVGSNDGTLHAIDTGSGRAAWKRDAGSPILAGAAFDEESNRVIAGTKDGRVLCVVAKDGAVVWSARVGSTVNAKPRITEGRVLVGTNGGKLHAIDLATGEIRWTVEGKRGFDATPAVVGDMVVAPAYDGTVHFVRVSDGSVRGTRDLGSQIWSSPAPGRDVVYVGTFAGSLVALALP